jgi:hypothetical protein
MKNASHPKGGRSAKTDMESVASLGVLLDSGKESVRFLSYGE